VGVLVRGVVTACCGRAWGVWIAAALLLVALQTSAPAIELLDLPLEHWAYEILERLEVRAGLGRTGLDVRPLRRGQVAELARRLRAGARAGTWTPTRIERQQLRMLEHEFSEEIVALGDTLPILQRTYHRWGGDKWQFQLFFFAGQLANRGNRDLSQDFTQVDAGVFFQPQAALQLGRCFLAFQDLLLRWRTTNGVLRNSTDPREGEAEFVFDASDRFSVTRTVQPYVRWKQGPLLVDVGRERLRWGPGRANAMLLLDGTPPLDVLRFDLDFGWIRYLHTIGQLRAGKLLPDDPELDDKHLGAHRLIIHPVRRLTLGVSETVVYGDRGRDLAYMNPLSVFFVTQANIGDRDNALASIDAKLLLASLELYGEFLVDDLNLRRGLRYFGNKIGVLAGFLWVQPFGAGDWDLDGEWSWASQFTYTHQIPINRYQHFGATLGSRAGPDADLWIVGLRRQLSRGWWVRGFYELERHGEGGLGIDQDQRLDDEQEYLSGVVESRHQPGLQVRYRGLRNLELFVDYRYVRVTNPDNDDRREALQYHAVRAATRIEF
jgi:hypothetical protein